MQLLDVNVLVNAFRPDAPKHETAFAYLSAARQGTEPVIVLPEVAVGFLRVVTHRGIFTRPDTPAAAMNALASWCNSSVVSVQEAGAGRWATFESLMTQRPMTGGDVHDGLLAAAAIDMGATLVTSDQGFTRFAGLRIQRL